MIVGNRISILLFLATQKPACRGLSSPVRPAHSLTANQESGRTGLHSPFSHFHKFSVMLTVKELGFEWRSPCRACQVLSGSAIQPTVARDTPEMLI